MIDEQCMKVKEMQDGTLKIDPDVLGGAEEAFHDLRYVEAFALLQAFIDWWMTVIFQLDQHNKGVDTGAIHFRTDHTFKSLRKYLHQNNHISEKEREMLDRFYLLRNRIVHRLVMYAYQDYPRNRITKADAEEGFKLGRQVAMLLEKKTDRWA